MTAGREVRLRRLRLRSWRRGTREMDLILGPFADAALAALDRAGLDDYEALLAVGDNDLYQWVSSGAGIPAEHARAIGRIRAFHGIG